MRARELGIAVGNGRPGPLNAITDVDGVRVGHTTLVEGDGVRTGVTVVVPADEAVFAAPFRLNGNGEMTGLEWVRESGTLETPVGLTNTHSVGVVRDALIGEMGERDWSLPVVAETWDGWLNDINGFHVSGKHAQAALAAASDGPVPEGNVGGGTGMICHGFKGGIGTASRATEAGHVVGVLVQANHGRRDRLQVNGVPVGAELAGGADDEPARPDGAGSIIVLVATDAALLPHQCERLAIRAALGIGRTGGAGEDSSGDLLLAWATGNHGLQPVTDDEVALKMLPNAQMDHLFYAAIDATEEAILNAMLAAETMTGRSGRKVDALDPDRLRDVLSRYGRPAS